MNNVNTSTEVNISATNGFNDMFNPVNNRLYNGNPVVLVTLDSSNINILLFI